MKLSGGDGGLAAPTLMVLLVLLLGATVYLWQARYIRRVTAYVLLAANMLAIVAVALWSYRNPT
jgi:hypothetical protein